MLQEEDLEYIVHPSRSQEKKRARKEKREKKKKEAAAQEEAKKAAKQERKKQRAEQAAALARAAKEKAQCLARSEFQKHVACILLWHFKSDRFETLQPSTFAKHCFGGYFIVSLCQIVCITCHVCVCASCHTSCRRKFRS